MSQTACLCVKAERVSGSALNHVIETLIKLGFLFPPLPPVCLYPRAEHPNSMWLSTNQITPIVTMEPTEGFTMLPWKLHLFTTALNVKGEDGHIDSYGEITSRLYLLQADTGISLSSVSFDTSQLLPTYLQKCLFPMVFNES